VKRHSRGSVKYGIPLMTGILLGSSIVGPLQASEHAYGLGYVATHDDNITRVATDKRSDWIHSVLAGLAYQENTPSLAAHVLAQAEFDNYQKNTFGNETLYYLDSSAVWTISPQRFLWALEDSARQALIDSTSVDTPANRTGINVLSTGPDVLLQFSPVHTLALGARVGHVNSGRADVDNDRSNVAVGWLYKATSITTYSLNYEALDVNYDNSTLNNDFRRQDGFARVEYHPSRSRFALDLGASYINRDRGDDLKGSLARLMWTRELTEESSFGISTSREFFDTGSDILAESHAVMTAPVTTASTAASTVLASGVVAHDVYVAKRGEVFYTRHGSQIGVKLDASYRKFDFETTPDDRKETGGTMELAYSYSAETTASLIADYTKTEYLNFVRSDTDRDFGVRIGYRLSPRVSLGLEGHRTDRASTDPTLDFIDKRVLISVLYSSGPLFTPVLGR
jgi:hypothetical protein